MYTDQRANAITIISNSNVVPFTWYSGRFFCIYCKELIPNVNDIRSHSVAHADRLQIFDKLRTSVDCIKIEISNLKCSICDEEIESFSKFKAHLIDAHEKALVKNHSDGVIPFSFSSDQYTCIECGENFTLFFNLNKHMNKHYQSHVCDFCGKGFAAVHRLKSHMLSHEMGSYPCEKCGAVLRTKTIWYNHLSKIHGPKTKYACPHCEKKFVNYTVRINHLKEAHGLKTEYECTYCPAVFKLYNARTKHVKNVHIRERVNRCHICPSKFVTVAELRSHVLTHGDERFQCEICKKLFTRKNALRVHIKSVHVFHVQE